MIDHCCDANCLFDAKEAKSKARSYRKKGARKATRRLIEMMKPGVSTGDSLLDIGGGIGALGLEMAQLGTYTSVDASAAYQQQAKRLFAENQWSPGKLHFMEADFVEVASEIPPHVHVSLDKVICCYPDVDKLLTAAARHGTRQLGLVYPLTGFIANIFQGLANLYFRIRGTAFRTYLHPPQKVAALLKQEGFVLQEKKTNIPWQIELWQRM